MILFMDGASYENVRPAHVQPVPSLSSLWSWFGMLTFHTRPAPVPAFKVHSNFDLLIQLMSVHVLATTPSSSPPPVGTRSETAISWSAW
jgi:hypothetical protein